MALDKEKTLSSAQKYIDKEQYDKAIKELLKITEVEPDDERTLLRLATCYEQANKAGDAGGIYMKIAQLYRSKGAYQKALAILKQAQKCLPEDDDIAMGMAELNSALGLPHEAVAQLEKCLGRCDRTANSRAYIKILQTMVRVDSENVQTRTNYAAALRDDGDTEGAKRQYMLALAQLSSKERYVDYIQISRDYLKMEPKDVDVLRELSQIYIRMERYSEVLGILSDLLPNERTPEIREQFITCYIKLRRNAEAVRELKALARQLEENGDRPDLVEEAWLRAQKMAPNDPEIMEALGDVPPMLSESALNVVSPAMDAARNNPAVSEISQAERELAVKFSRALESYRQGRLDEAQYLCQQIIICNEEHISALQLLSQIFESLGDNASEAQIERKLAKATFDNDPDEGVRHILKAEKCTPRAWENFNLMLVFGLEPSEYGMSAPEMSHGSSHSNPQIPARQMAAAPPVSAVKPIPTPPPRPNVPPPIPPRGIPAQGKSIAPPPIRPVASGAVSNVQPLSSDAAPVAQEKVVHNIKRPATLDSAVKSQPAGGSPYQVSSVKVAEGGCIADDVIALSNAVTDELDDMFVSMCKSPGGSAKPPVKAAERTESVSSVVQTPAASPELFKEPSAHTVTTHSVMTGVRSISGVRNSVPGMPAVTSISGVRGAVPGMNGGASISGTRNASTGGTGVRGASAVSGVRAGVSGVHGGMTSSIRGAVPSSDSLISVEARTVAPRNAFSVSADAPKTPASMTPVVQKAVPQPGLSRTAASIQPRQGGVSVSGIRGAVMHSEMNEPAPVVAKPVGIPDSERQRVQEALQEIEFYASLNLVDDARKLLQGLIDEFGDTDIIHDAKMKLDACT